MEQQAQEERELREQAVPVLNENSVALAATRSCPTFEELYKAAASLRQKKIAK